MELLTDHLKKEHTTGSPKTDEEILAEAGKMVFAYDTVRIHNKIVSN
jgi:hypothetical protein